MKLSQILLLAGMSAVLAGCGEGVPKVCEQVIDKSLAQAKELGVEAPSREVMIEDLKQKSGGDEKKMEEACNQALNMLESVEKMKNSMSNMLK